MNDIQIHERERERERETLFNSLFALVVDDMGSPDPAHFVRRAVLPTRVRVTVRVNITLDHDSTQACWSVCTHVRISRI